MTTVRDRIFKLVRSIDSLDAAVRRSQQSKPTLSKRVPLFESTAFVIPLGEGGIANPVMFNTLEQYWTNGADDAYITEVCHSTVGIITTGGVMAQGPRLLYDTEAGLFAYGDGGYIGATRQGGPIFDFEWNFRMGVSGQMYATSPKGDRYLSRKSLGNKYQDRPLRFVDPLFVKAGDSIIWMLKPTMFNPGAEGIAPPSSASGGVVNNFQAIVVNMLMWGYRDGTMAVPEYSLGPADMKQKTDLEAGHE